MAKRTTPRAQAEDTATAAPPPKPRKSKAAPGAPAPDTLGVLPDTLAVQSGVEGHEPTEDDIRRRAYERYLERGGGQGTDFQDWLEAERELKRSKSKV
jgi:hypothetical protein